MTLHAAGHSDNQRLGLTDGDPVTVLQALLLATLERLEGVEAVVAAADATSAAMEDKVRPSLWHHLCWQSALGCAHASLCSVNRPA